MKAVIFDLDGVVIDSREFHYLVYDEMFKERKIEYPFEEFAQNFGVGAKNIFRMKGFSDEDSEKLANVKDEKYRKAAKGRIRLVNGARPLMAEIKNAGIKMALATSTQMVNVDFILDELKLHGMFDAIVAFGDVKKAKPDPEVFLAAAKKLGVEPDECVVIEDSIHGVDAAVAARMPCVALTTTHPKEQLKKANLVVRDHEDLGVGVLGKVKNG